MKEGKKLSPKAIFGIFMVLFYLCLAGIMVFTDVFKESIGKTLCVIIGILLLLYGIFRGIRAWRDL
ncbi:MAG: hypothetical protein LBN74_07415 [Prevotella sp.]|jgi:uncharacterized membrane protein HdeD (DUF308 family)|nr:hypothetical protein [Prevotella sp.]